MPIEPAFDLRKIKNKFYKILTLCLFFCLPSKLTNIFVSLSIITMILKLRNTSLLSEELLLVRIEKLLKISLNEQVLLLPEQTISWYWSTKMLETPLEVDGKTATLKEVLTNARTFVKHRNLAMNKLLDSLPKTIQYKLKLTHVENRIAIKHNILNALMYA